MWRGPPGWRPDALEQNPKFSLYARATTCWAGHVPRPPVQTAHGAHGGPGRPDAQFWGSRAPPLASIPTSSPEPRAPRGSWKPQGGLGQQRNQPNRLQPTPGHWAPGLRTGLPANAPEQAVPPGHRADPRKGKSHQLQTPPRTRPERASPVPQLAWTGRQAPGSRSGQALGFLGGCEHGGGRATAPC